MQPQSEFTDAFRGALMGGALPDIVTAVDEVARRFAVYRNNVAHSLSQALARRYPVIQRLVGETFFAAMGREFVALHPPRNPVLQEWGAGFAAFLDGFPPLAALPYLGDVARIEWARGRAYHAADAVALQPDALPTEQPLCLHPSLHLLQLRHPGVSIWQANQPGRDGRVRAAGAEIALIWRRPDFEVAVQALSPLDAGFIAALKDGVSLEAASGLTDPVPMLSLLLRDGLICRREDAQ